MKVTGETPPSFGASGPKLDPLNETAWKKVTAAWGPMSAVDVREAFGTVAPMFESARIGVLENVVWIQANYDVNPERLAPGEDNGPRPVVAMFRAGRMMRGAWNRRVDSRKGFRAGTCSLHVNMHSTKTGRLEHVFSGVFVPDILNNPEDYTEEAVKEQMVVIDGFINALEDYRG